MIPLTDVQPDFQYRGACRGHDPELFFPVSETGANAAQIAQAKAVCAGCPVLADCRAYALANGPQGIWGGMTEDERRAVRARENAAAVAHAETDQDVAEHAAEHNVGEDTQPESSPTLPSYETARQRLTRARRKLTQVQQTGDRDAIARTEQRVAAAEEEFAAARSRTATRAVA